MEELSMSSGVSVSVQNDSIDRSEPVAETKNTSVSREESQGAAYETSQEKDTVSDADRVLEAVKEDGLEEVFVKLAEGEILGEENEAADEGQVEEGIVEDVLSENDQEAIKEPVENEGETVETLYQQSLVDQIGLLKDKVKNLEEKNGDLVEKLNSLKHSNPEAEFLMQMIIKLKKMAEEEEDDESKMGFFEFLVALFEKMAIALVTPEDSEPKKPEPLVLPKVTPKKKSKADDITDDMLKGMLLQFKQPARTKAA